MKIEHVAMYVQDLEAMKAFYETYFNAKSNEKYHNPKTSLMTYFLTFESGARLELMTRAHLNNQNKEMSTELHILRLLWGVRKKLIH